MKIKILLFIVINFLVLNGCTGAKGILPKKELVTNIKFGAVDTTYYIFREKQFGGSLMAMSVVCNDELFNLAVGEFVECKPWAPINYIGIDVDEDSERMSAFAMSPGVGLLYSIVTLNSHYGNNFLTKASSRIFSNKLEGNRFVLLEKPSIFNAFSLYSPNDEIPKDQALKLIEAGYKLVEAPEFTSPIFRHSAILNPYSSIYYDFLTANSGELPQMRVEKSGLSSFIRGKQGVLIYSDSDIKYPAGIWFKDKYIGSLTGQSYIFVETAPKKETLYTYIRGTLRKILFTIKEGEITYIKLDADFNSISGTLGARKFSSSTREQFMSHFDNLNRLELNQNSDISPKITEIEIEGINILNELVGSK